MRRLVILLSIIIIMGGVVASNSHTSFDGVIEQQKEDVACYDPEMLHNMLLEEYGNHISKYNPMHRLLVVLLPNKTVRIYLHVDEQVCHYKVLEEEEADHYFKSFYRNAPDDLIRKFNRSIQEYNTGH